MKHLAGKVALVTGGATGIGLAIARTFASAGMRIALGYRSDTHLGEALASFGSHPELTVHPVQMDVTDRDAVRRAAAEVERVFGKVHVLCNNAGVNLIGAMDEATYEDWDWVLGVNLGGIVNTLVTFLPGMKAHGEGGHVINVASMSAFITGPNTGIYATAKFAVRGLSESLRYNLAPHKIGVSLLCPGLTQSRIFEASLRRPRHLQNTAFPVDTATRAKFAELHANGMDADEVARKALRAVLHNQFYVFSHAEFREEVRDLAAEIDTAFPDEAPDQKRMVFETIRRQAALRAKKAIAELDEERAQQAGAGERVRGGQRD